MSTGWGVLLPLNTDPVDGWHMSKELRQVVREHIKMLLLTNPGERLMMPNYGCGLQWYMFEPNTSIIHGEMEIRIRKQFKVYLSYITIVDIMITAEEDLGEVRLQMKYFIKSLGEDATIDLIWGITEAGVTPPLFIPDAGVDLQFGTSKPANIAGFWSKPQDAASEWKPETPGFNKPPPGYMPGMMAGGAANAAPPIHGNDPDAPL